MKESYLPVLAIGLTVAGFDCTSPGPDLLDKKFKTLEKITFEPK